jgi:hypothetical protein
MKVQENPEKRAQLITMMAEREFSERTGIHQSDLVYCLNKSALRRMKPRASSPRDVLVFAMGWATQRWLTGQPDEEPIIKDGITVTMDCKWPTNPDVPWELKGTYQSSLKPIIQNVHWVRQLMAQAHVTNQKMVTLSRYEVMGNWKWVYRPKNPEKLAALVEEYGPDWDMHPDLHVYDITFTRAELMRNWNWLQDRKAFLETILETKELLPRVLALPTDLDTEDVEDFECAYCPYNNEEDCPHD